MEERIAYCGINCLECGAYNATQNNDDELRKKTAREWSEKFNFEFKWENLVCDGGCCDPQGQVTVYCQSCAIRKCGLEKGVINCAHCGDYPCATLDEFLQFVPGSRKTLDAINKGIK